MRLIIGILLGFTFLTPALASEDDVGSAYQAYQESQQNGDLREALEHARRANQEAALEWGANTPETYRYVATLVKTNNDLLRYDDALEAANPAIDADQQIEGWLPFSYELYFETGRALRGRHQDEDAQSFFRVALQIAETSYGADSLRAAYTHMELARTYPDYSAPARGDALRNRLIGSGYPQQAGNAASLGIASNYFAQRQESVLEHQIMEVIQAGTLMASNNMDGAGEILEPAIAALAGYGYMEDYVLGIYIDWIASHLTHWPTRRMERNLLQAMEYGLMRREGTIIPLAGTSATVHRRHCVDRVENGYAIVEYSVNANGQVPRTRIVETNMPSWWEDEQRATMRTWIFVPTQQNGQPTRVDGFRRNIVMGGTRGC